ncbi:unnamed protein product [Effrenium voratum]|nr:unnamed protein product [Effrenium voratum]
MLIAFNLRLKFNAWLEHSTMGKSTPRRVRSLVCALCVCCPGFLCAILPLVESGIQYVPPYDVQVRQRLKCIAGQRLGDALRAARVNTSGEALLPIFERISPDWWLEQMKLGKVQVERCRWQHVELEQINESHLVHKEDRVRLMIHVHERATATVNISIIHEDQDFFVVSKPAGVDIFPNPMGGSVRLSLLGMLEAAGHGKLMPAHRIDKPVSGVLCFAKHKKAASRIQRTISQRKVRKTYLARVLGTPSAGQRICANLIRHVENAKQMALVSPDGKPAETLISQVWPHEDGTSTVAVQPLTGRLHQIRCHLQYGGWPICNDPLYGGAITDEPPEVFGGPSSQEMMRRDVRRFCLACEYYQRLLDGEEPKPRLDPPIWLHSWRYEFPKLKLAFEAPPPAWAQV